MFLHYNFLQVAVTPIDIRFQSRLKLDGTRVVRSEAAFL